MPEHRKSTGNCMCLSARFPDSKDEQLIAVKFTILSLKSELVGKSVLHMKHPQISE